MEVLYDDLENYNDVNAVIELRKENEELKLKLEEYSAAMEKLQKDYDKLEHGFKTLEKNYSSLLITARDEVKRKTEQISKLNIEKDKMILESLQKKQKWNNKGKGPKQSNVNVPNTANQQNVNRNTTKKEDFQRKIDPATDRYDKGTNRTCFTSKMDTPTTKMSSQNYKSEENQGPSQYRHEYNKDSKITVKSIKNRRKSMPGAGGMESEKYNYNEENDTRQPFKGAPRTEFDRPERRHLDKIASDRHSNKTSETSSLDERNSNYQDSRDYRGRPGRSYETDKYRGRDRYEGPQKQKCFSPERFHRKTQKEYRDDNHRPREDNYRPREDSYRPEQGKYRVLGSPPPDSYSRQRRSHDSRSNYDRHPHETERYRHNYEENYPAKHMMPIDYDEPQTKRPKMDTYENPERHFEEERSYPEKLDVENLPNPADLLDYDTRASCQSPDFSDVPYEHTVKEIRSTAAGQLEDPRDTSQKYVVKAENGTTTISTVAGRNVFIAPIDKSLWHIDKVDVPDALLNQPQNNEEVINQIYMDTDNPVSYSSPEPGEICDGIENLVNDNDNLVSETIETTKVTTEIKPQNHEKSGLEPKAKSRVSKAKKTNKNIVNDVTTLTPDLPELKPEKIKKSSKTVKTKSNAPSASLPQISFHNEYDSHKAKPKKSSTKEQLIEVDESTTFFPASYDKTVDNESIENQIRTRASIALVEGDLELSDEASDFIESKRKSSEKLNKPSKKKQVDECNLTSSDTIEKMVTIHHNISTIISKDIPEKNNIDQVESTEEPFSNKNKKTKKKKNKSKEIDSKESIDDTDEPKSDKKPKSKKDKDNKPKEMKSKFCDLFGDSSSLITPEDLGIPVYEPVVCEDAQDAVDINIRDAKEQEPKPMNEKDLIENVNNNTSGKENVGKPTTNNDAENILQALNTDTNITKTNDKNIRSLTNTTKTSEQNDLPPNLIYENLESGVKTSNNDVVKTVIISTGVQPQFDSDNNIEIVERLIDNESQPLKLASIPGIKEVKGQFALKALATSTPFKEIMGIVSNADEVICSANKSQSEDVLTTTADVTESSTLDIQNDAPDVRIFVTRRRKGVKRPRIT